LTPDKHEVLKAWIAAILWLIVIAIESTSLLSSSNTSRILYPMFHLIFGLSHPAFEVWNGYIRKAGHVFGYGFLCILLFRAWRSTVREPEGPTWTLRWASIAVFGTALVASLDEWHQTFLPSRTGRWQDVVLDTSAGIAAQLVLFLLARR